MKAQLVFAVVVAAVAAALFVVGVNAARDAFAVVAPALSEEGAA